jgi:hypothetical protein
MVLRETWEEPSGAYFRAGLMDGLPESMLDELRRGEWGASLGARPVRVTRTYLPKPSAYNPKGLEERVYHELEALDVSLTKRPHYESEARVMLRSLSDEFASDGLILLPRGEPRPVRDYLADEPEWRVPAPRPASPAYRL